MEQEITIVLSKYTHLLEELNAMFKDLEHVIKENTSLREQVQVLEEQVVQLGGVVAKEAESVVAQAKIDEMALADVSGMAVNVFNALHYGAGIKTLGELASRKASEILRINRIGKVSLNEIAEFLYSRGLDFVKEDSVLEQKRIDKILLPSKMKSVKVEDLGLSKKAFEWMCKLKLETVYNIWQYDGATCYLNLKIQDEEAFENIVSCLEKHGFSYPFSS